MRWHPSSTTLRQGHGRAPWRHAIAWCTQWPCFTSSSPSHGDRTLSAWLDVQQRHSPGSGHWQRGGPQAGSAPEAEPGSSSSWFLIHGNVSTKGATRRPQCLPRSTGTGSAVLCSQVPQSHSGTLQGRSHVPTLSPTMFASWGLEAPQNAQLKVQGLIMTSKCG